MPHLEVSGARLYYETDGHISSPAVLLIHAGIANLRMWDPQVPALASRHLVIRFDTRGYGETETEDVPFSNREDAIALLDHLGVARATVIGCSRGGSIGIDLAIEHPDRVAGIVTIGSGPSGFPEVELTEREDELFDELDALFEAKDWEQLARREAELWDFGPLRSAQDLDPSFVATAYELNAANVRHTTEKPTTIPLEPPAYDRVVDIAVPALVMVGDHDLSPTLAQYEYLLSTIPGADGCRFPDSAHLPSVEQPAEFERVLLAWLDEHNL
ncbi:pimeloyl-ACP methyl ester carboxylesterase [Cryobacterium mesophilum]|uniref:Alpha/beta fold hydrolase n=1 Tax=Terrimesophilobacter mesophilus TaxID=433647 RepID=A0A4R8V9G1_9MICO|nr:alpha/beta fold hydrolase [Terrimesophilobacter mesophilus]MBB5633039.1 pimeloyl-ACP methyl ester carboxylesterase [Terrimesophilobacter mesophilus]TFB79804.1 alpha/beta fold hydrolase [Terrimesophilobacter mesophilus]